MTDGEPTRARRRGTPAEVASWWVLAWIIGSTVIALFPYAYIGLLSFLLLPVAAISWSRTIILSVPAREGGKRAFIVGGLAIGTIIGAAILFAFVRALLGRPTND
jgi:hypothetical protein